MFVGLEHGGVFVVDFDADSVGKYDAEASGDKEVEGAFPPVAVSCDEGENAYTAHGIR